MTNFANPLYNALALTLTRLLEAVCVVRQQMLVDTRGATDGCQRKIRFIRMQQRSSVDAIIFKLIISIDKPLGNFITISQHSFYMEIKGLLGFLLKFTKSVGSKHYRTWNILTERCRKILLAPGYIYSNLLHFVFSL